MSPRISLILTYKVISLAGLVSNIQYEILKHGAIQPLNLLLRVGIIGFQFAALATPKKNDSVNIEKRKDVLNI